MPEAHTISKNIYHARGRLQLCCAQGLPAFQNKKITYVHPSLSRSRLENDLTTFTSATVLPPTSCFDPTANFQRNLGLPTRPSIKKKQTRKTSWCTSTQKEGRFLPRPYSSPQRKTKKRVQYTPSIYMYADQNIQHVRIRNDKKENPIPNPEEGCHQRKKGDKPRARQATYSSSVRVFGCILTRTSPSRAAPKTTSRRMLSAPSFPSTKYFDARSTVPSKFLLTN